MVHFCVLRDTSRPAQVSLMQLDPLLLHHDVHFFLISEGLWAIRYWTWALLCDPEFHSQKKKLCFSAGYHNVRCVHRIINWLNRNFYSISVKNFHNLNFPNWSNDCSFGNSCHDLGFGEKIEKLSIPGIEEWLFPIRRLHLVEFCAASRLSHDIGSKLFRIIVWAVFYWPALRSSKHFLASCVQLLLSEEIPRVVLLPVFNVVNTCCPHEDKFVHFLLLSSRIGDTNSLLLRKYWADLQNELFGTRVLCSSNVHWSEWYFYLFFSFKIPRLKALILSNTRWPVFESLYHFVGCRIPPFFERKKNFHTTSLPTLNPKMSNVLAGISSRNSWLSRYSKYNYHHFLKSMSLIWSFWTPRAGCSFSPSLAGSLEQ